MTRFKLLAVLLVVLSVASAATMATIGGAKTKGSNDTEQFVPGSPLLVFGGSTAEMKFWNLSPGAVGVKTGCADVNGDLISGCENAFTVPSGGIGTASLSFGTNTEIAPFACTNAKPHEYRLQMVFHDGDNNMEEQDIGEAASTIIIPDVNKLCSK
jgi:hypothetical protein